MKVSANGVCQGSIEVSLEWLMINLQTLFFLHIQTVILPVRVLIRYLPLTCIGRLKLADNCTCLDMTQKEQNDVIYPGQGWGTVWILIFSVPWVP